MRKFYVDTNIWLDFALDRRDSVRPLGELALQFFKKCLRERWQILYSDAVVMELGRKLAPEEIEERCFKIVSVEGLLVKVPYSKSQAAEAKNISIRKKLPFLDTLHAIIARDNNAMVVSRNFHFEGLLDIVSVYSPEEV